VFAQRGLETYGSSICISRTTSQFWTCNVGNYKALSFLVHWS